MATDIFHYHHKIFDLLFLKTLNKHRCQLYMTKTEIAIPTQIHSAECLNAQKKYQFNP
jgi:hypothetical protein